jgi:hypothetical protein
MILNKLSARRTTRLAATLLVAVSLASAADDAASSASPAAGSDTVQTSSQTDEIARLKAQLAAQQKQLETIERMMEQQQRLLEKAVNTPAAQPGSVQVTPRPNLGSVASLTPVVPAPAAAPVAIPAVNRPAPQNTPAASGNPCEADQASGNAVPAYLRLGSTCIIPIGFMDLTGIWRNVNAASGIGTNFASIPYNNTPAGHNAEFRFSPQNSRIGFRVDGDWKGTHFIGYNEFDFLGTSGGFNLGITNGAFVPRLRLFWVDVTKDKWEFLAGQSWSMLTPNRKGISPLPGDIFYSQVMDVNYLIGLTWTRQPGIRILYHPNQKLTLALAAENPDQQIGGSAGAPVVTLPASLTSLAGSQIDNATNVLNTPNLIPDFIFKVAYDPSSRAHLEVAGLARYFKIWNPNTNQHSSSGGFGFTWGINVELVKNLRVISNGYWSDGGGRYLFGTIPDFILRADGGISPIHAGGTTDGFEYTVKNTLLFVYYGGAYAGRNVAVDANGSLVGYGYRGSANSNNRVMEEITGGFNQTMWKSPRYGAINLIGQYEYAWREPWYLAIGNPKAAHDNAIYMDLRYTLPGGMPNF